MKITLLISSVLFFIAGYKQKGQNSIPVSFVAQGQMPNIIKDKSGNIHLVYGSGDSILYSISADEGNTFSAPSLVAVLPKLTAAATRGPQIAVTNEGLLITACNRSGNIYSYVKPASKKWILTGRVNDMDTVAKENLMGLSADGKNAFAVWLDLRDKHNKIYGARSIDAGSTWQKNILIYASPDKTVCECCKPSVAIKGKNVYVLFRNWLNGNRDLYLIQSKNGGTEFQVAQKLGNGSWALKGCPMDGGGISISEKGKPGTVWNRKGTIYSCIPGENEIEVGKGRSCTMEIINGKNNYAWVENGEVVVVNSQGIKTNLGKGQLPQIKAINNKLLICIWENNKQIYKAVLEI